MGVEYYADVGFGFVVSMKALDKGFLRTRKPKFEMQPRYNERTGERMADVEVEVERGYDYYLLDGEEYDSQDLYGFADAIAQKVGAHEGCIIGDQNCGPEHLDIAFCVSVKRVPKTGFDGGKFNVGSDYYLTDLFSKTHKFPKIQAALRKLGLKVGAPRVVQIWGAT
jgi:hypothetical protein